MEAKFAAGAYDATALYHSMHPFTDPSKSKLFEKYKVGVHIAPTVTRSTTLIALCARPENGPQCDG